MHNSASEMHKCRGNAGADQSSERWAMHSAFTPPKMVLLAKVMDDACRELGCDDDAQREVIAARIMSIAATGSRDYETLFSIATFERDASVARRLEPMERLALLEHLEVAKQCADRGRELVARQKTGIAAMGAAGVDTGDAEKILQTLEETQTIHLVEVRRILNALDRMPMAGLIA
jgi:hypothetical protein